MRSLVMAVFYFTGAGGSAVAQMLVPLSEDPLLVWNYVAAAILSLIASVGVWWCNRGSDKPVERVEVVEEMREVDH